VSRKFTLVIERDPETGWLVGSVPQLPGCYSQAPSLSELEAGIREAIAAYLGEEEPDLDLSEFVGVHTIEVAL